MIVKHTFLLLFFFFLSFFAYTQISPSSDSSQPVEILPGVRKFELKRLPDGTDLQILAGNVRLRQGSTLFSCDSCVLNSASKIFDAFGRVHINDDDTINVYSNKLHYLYDQKYAYLDGAVRLTDGKGVLTTNNLEYDVTRRIGNYKNGGKVVSKKTVITSGEATYYAEIKDVYFRKKVVMKDPANTVTADSILYNVDLQLASFIADTKIKDSSGRIINTKGGTLLTSSGKAEFTQRTTIIDKALTITGDEIKSDDSTGIVQIRGRGVLIDTSKGISILSNSIFVNKKAEAFLATQKPLMIIKQNNDSIFIAADTLFSAKLTDLFVDTAKNKRKVNPNDSTNRYFEAYRHVRVFSDSFQTVSDSLFYSFKDSVFQLFQDPVVWSRKSQVTGDTIYLHTKNKKPNYLKVMNNSFLVTEVSRGAYNQIKSSKMDAYFKNGVLDSVRAKGMAESIYFIQDKDSSFSSVNQTKSDVIDIQFDSGELNKIILRNSVQGTLTPVKQKAPDQARLEKFRWLDARRPKTKFELLEE